MRNMSIVDALTVHRDGLDGILSGVDEGTPFHRDLSAVIQSINMVIHFLKEEED